MARGVWFGCKHQRRPRGRQGQRRAGGGPGAGHNPPFVPEAAGSLRAKRKWGGAPASGPHPPADLATRAWWTPGPAQQRSRRGWLPGQAGGLPLSPGQGPSGIREGWAAGPSKWPRKPTATAPPGLHRPPPPPAWPRPLLGGCLGHWGGRSRADLLWSEEAPAHGLLPTVPSSLLPGPRPQAGGRGWPRLSLLLPAPQSPADMTEGFAPRPQGSPACPPPTEGALLPAQGHLGPRMGVGAH